MPIQSQIPIVLDGRPIYDHMGPFIYNVTVHNDLIGWDSDNGTMTYSSYDVFEHCSDCVWEDSDGVPHQSMPGDTLITNQNILWNTQLMAGISTGIEYGEQFAKAGFSKNMVTYDMMYQHQAWKPSDIDGIVQSTNTMVQAQTGGTLDAMTVASMSDAMVMDGSFSAWNASLDDVTRGALGADSMSPDFTACSVDTV